MFRLRQTNGENTCFLHGIGWSQLEADTQIIYQSKRRGRPRRRPQSVGHWARIGHEKAQLRTELEKMRAFALLLTDS